MDKHTRTFGSNKRFYVKLPSALQNDRVSKASLKKWTLGIGSFYLALSPSCRVATAARLTTSAYLLVVLPRRGFTGSLGCIRLRELWSRRSFLPGVPSVFVHHRIRQPNIQPTSRTTPSEWNWLCDNSAAPCECPRARRTSVRATIRTATHVCGRCTIHPTLPTRGVIDTINPRCSSHGSKAYRAKSTTTTLFAAVTTEGGGVGT